MKENRLRSWLYKILARLEIEDYQDAEMRDEPNVTIITIRWNK